MGILQALMEWFEWLFSSKKTNVYNTFSMKDYYRAVGRLKESGVKYRVVVRAQFPAGGQWGAQNNEYTIYVKEADKYRAQNAIHGH
ncbi:MAG TPA: hypothetical protein VFK44_09775 [Bacillales bacterium]|nr:hypothetical protein [Bacillales bacterium]